MKSSNAVVEGPVAVEDPPEKTPDNTDQTPPPLQFLPTGDAFGVCDVNGECS